MKKLASIIIRTKNEERWINACLQSVFSQDYGPLEVIIVDNNSTDKTLEKAKTYNVKVVNVKKYLPGKALNRGVKASSGEYIVCLSGHCIPKNTKWLSNLIKNFESHKKAAAVYGRQEPMSFSSEYDKRDLMITFGLDKKIQKKDAFFHNANSVIRRDVWKEFPFDEKVTNIEDRVWAQKVLKNNFEIIYEPIASVYHYHGIHHDRNPERCLKVTRIMENLQKSKKSFQRSVYKIQDLKCAVMIPVKGRVPMLGGKIAVGIYH